MNKVKTFQEGEQGIRGNNAKNRQNNLVDDKEI